MAHQRYFDGSYSQNNPTWHDEDAKAKAKTLCSLVEFCGLHPKTVIDVGCGRGGVLQEMKRTLAHRLPNTTWEGWDVAPKPVAFARQREGEGLAYVCDDFLRSERRADLLICIDTAEHVLDDVGFLRALRPRAPWFLFRFPLDLSVWDVVRQRRLRRVRAQYGHLHLYTRSLVLDRLAEAGFDVVARRYDRTYRARSLRAKVVDSVRSMAYSVHADRAVDLLGGYSLVVCCKPLVE